MKGVHMTQLFSRRTYGAVLLAAAGMMALSPVQTGAAFLAAGTAALSASPALAFGKLKGCHPVSIRWVGHCRSG
jgi:hypothetical protein